MVHCESQSLISSQYSYWTCLADELQMQVIIIFVWRKPIDFLLIFFENFLCMCNVSLVVQLGVAVLCVVVVQWFSVVVAVVFVVVVQCDAAGCGVVAVVFMVVVQCGSGYSVCGGGVVWCCWLWCSVVVTVVFVMAVQCVAAGCGVVVLWCNVVVAVLFVVLLIVVYTV